MSVKRQAASELNHDNWNDDDPAEAKEMGQFKAASKDVLEKRVIRTARRKNPISSEANKSVFSGFGGFNKAQPSSFDFLANVTNVSNGNKGSNGSIGPNTATTPSGGLFTNKPAAPGTGIFGIQTSTTPMSSGPTTMTSAFGSTVKTSPSTFFTMTKADASKDTPFKMQSISSSVVADSPNLTTKPPAPVPSNVFGVPSTSANDGKQLFSSKNSTPFKIPASNTNTAMVQTSLGSTNKSAVTPVTPDKKDNDEKSNDKTIKYYSKLKGLNESVSDWINKHVAQTPLCILSPIFKDYEKYLKEITEEYQSGDKEGSEIDVVGKNKLPNTSPFTSNNTGSSAFPASDNTKTSIPFGISPNNNSSRQEIKMSTPFGTSPNNNSSSQDIKMNTPFGISPDNNTFNRETKLSTPFGIDNTTPKPFSNQNTNTSPFAIKNIGSSPMNNQETKSSSPFAANNTSSAQFTSPSAKTSSPFGVNNAGASPLNSQGTNASTPFGVNSNSSPFGSNSSSAAPKHLFGTQNTVAQTPESKAPTFSFGSNITTNVSNISTPSTGFSFGAMPSSTSASASPFTQNTNPSGNTAGAAPFSFGMGKPFSFAPNTVQQPSSEAAAAENEDEEPPKVEYTPVKEDNSVYEKKCKIFVKKDGNFADKGVGTLYIKKVEGNAKHQLLVRANTNLGTVLLNLMLAEAIPTQRMGKNNVMMVCIPTPDAQPPPTPILIRVKTGEEADELLETLNKYKA